MRYPRRYYYQLPLMIMKSCQNKNKKYLNILLPQKEPKKKNTNKKMAKQRKHIPMSTLNTLHLIVVPLTNSPRDKAVKHKRLLMKSPIQRTDQSIKTINMANIM
jgi:hypothetical protein